MKINEILSEAKFRKPIIVYHGTSSKFLRSILKQGIVPQAKEKVWADDPDAAIDRPSRASIGGSYWTSSILTATSSAGNSRRKFGGEKLFIIAQISEGSALADEDQISYAVKYDYNTAVKEVIGGIIPEAIHVYVNTIYDDLEKRNRMVDIFAKSFHSMAVDAGSKAPVPNKILEEMFDAIVERLIAYTIAGKGRLSSWGNQDLRAELFKYVENKPDQILTTSQAEQKYARAMDKLTRYYRKTAYKETGGFSHTMRTEKPISFSGANKIISIIEILPDDSVVIHYGSKDLPKQFVDDWKQRIGSDLKIVEKGREKK